MKKIFVILSFLLCIGAKNYAQNVNIPDANFKWYLVCDSAIDTNNDNLIQVSEASNYAGAINVNSLGISDLTGIEAFTKIPYLDCSYNQLSSLDISNNIELVYFQCHHNQLTSLDVSTNTVLANLFCSNNQLSYLDVSANIALIYLNCQENQLTSLDVSNNTNLISLSCRDNQLASLNLSNNTALLNLYCQHNPNLSCIQVSDTTYTNVWTVANWNIDSTMFFSLDCGNVSTAENLSSALSILPNPASDYLYISYEGEKKLSFVISDIWGKTLAAWETTSTGAFYQKEVPIADFSAGIYFLSAQAGDKKVVKKFVKE